MRLTDEALGKLKEAIANLGDVAGPMTTFPYADKPEVGQVSLFTPKWVELIEWMAAMNEHVPVLIEEVEELRR